MDGGETKRTRPSDGSEFRGTGGGTWGRLDVDSKDESTSHWKIIASSADINRGISSSRERRWGENAGRCCCPSVRQGQPPTHPTPSPARGRGGTEENSDAAQKPIGSTNVIRGEGLERCRTSSPQREVCAFEPADDNRGQPWRPRPLAPRRWLWVTRPRSTSAATASGARSG